MMRLTSDTMLVKIDVVTAATLHLHGSWADIVKATGGYAAGGALDEVKSDTGEFTMIPSPAATEDRTVRYMSVKNKHASTTAVFRIEHTDGTDTVEVAPGTLNLAPDETLIINGDGSWFVFDANGGVKVGASQATDTVAGLIQIASQAEMEAGTDVSRAVTPGRQHFHPGSLKAWGKATGAGTSLTVNYNITSIADTGTGRLGVTIATDFSTANYAIGAQIERGVTTLGVADVEQCAIRNASPTAGVFEIESYDHTATTLVADDPANYFWMCAGDQ